MHPQLTALLTQLDAATAQARHLVSTVDDPTFQARPPRGGWSAAECMAHLNLTTTAFLPVIDSALTRGSAGFADTRRYRRGLVGWLLEWSLEPPARVRMRTQPSFVPNSTGPKDVVLRDFERLQQNLASRIRRAAGLNLNALGVRSVFNERVSYNLYAAFCVLLAHERRHLWQAERAAGLLA